MKEIIMFRTKFYKSFVFLLGLFITSTLPGPAGPQPGLAMLKAQPILIQIATSDPNQIVNVIVQKTSGAFEVEQQVLELGGTALQDLEIIHALSVRMSAGAALEIARSSDVRWV